MSLEFLNYFIPYIQSTDIYWAQSDKVNKSKKIKLIKEIKKKQEKEEDTSI